MAIISLCYGAFPAHSSKLGFHQTPIRRPDSSSINLHPISLTHSTSILRFKNAPGLLIGERLPSLQALNKPSGDSKGNTEAVTNGDTGTAQGPPFLTILAGIVVFGLLLWAVGSIVSWLIGLLGLIFSK
ncbi:hypothetical protein L1987_06124 [Smallanthus sonchifolius]|uniref:Uncharacterized protein n=1 Tax=Smallanthus sonchifolius TaxID=185202 RepID=A0ACB9JXE4_9ASTR|nr:hypothetical protein L1987_06124 [Smallanthus sonchifolius]